MHPVRLSAPAPLAVQRRAIRFARARWFLGLVLCVVVAPVVTVAAWHDQLAGQRFAQDHEVRTIQVEAVRRTNPGKYSIGHAVTTTVDGRQYEFAVGSDRPYPGDEIRVVFDGERMLALDRVRGDLDAALTGLGFGLVVLVVSGWTLLGRNQAPLRGVRDAARRSQTLEVTVVGWRRTRHRRGHLRDALRTFGYRGSHELDLATADGRQVRWTGQHRFVIWNDSWASEFDSTYGPKGLTGTLVGGTEPGQWAYLVMTELGTGRQRALPPSEPLVAIPSVLASVDLTADQVSPDEHRRKN